MIRKLLRATWTMYEALALAFLDGVCNFLRFAGIGCGLAVGAWFSLKIMKAITEAMAQ